MPVEHLSFGYYYEEKSEFGLHFYRQGDDCIGLFYLIHDIADLR